MPTIPWCTSMNSGISFPFLTAMADLGEGDRPRPVDDFFDDLGRADDRGSLAQLVLSDLARTRASAAEPDLAAVVDEVVEEFVEHRKPRLSDPFGSVGSAEPDGIDRAKDHRLLAGGRSDVRCH